MDGMYLFYCGLLGLGIAIDVSLATIAMYRRFPTFSDGWDWVWKVTFTHVAFPMIGYYGFAFAYRYSQNLDAVLGFIAFAAVLVFLVDAFRELFDNDEIDHGLAKIPWLAVLAVSWDALWSGPAKSAQALTWTPFEIILSFFIAGLVVTLVALASIWICVRLNRASAHASSIDMRARLETFGSYVEFVVIFYFGLLAVDRYIYGRDTEWWIIIAASGVVWGVLFLVNYAELRSARLPKYAALSNQNESD